MNASPASDPSTRAKKRLIEACRTKDVSVRLAWTITACEGVLLAGLALALIDYWLMLPVLWRSVGALGLAGLAAVSVFRFFRFYRRPTRLKEAALDMESERPELGCEISTAAEYLTGDRKITKEYEPALVAALQAKAAQKLSGKPVEYEKRLQRPAMLLALTLLFVFAILVVVPGALTALQRTALPGSKAHYTRLEVKPGNIEVPVGRNLEVTNLFFGRIPRDPQIHWSSDGNARWQTVALTRSADGAFRHAFNNLRSDVAYRVTGSDAESEGYTIRTYVPPEVKELSIQLSFPEYTKLKPAIQKSPNITAVRASTAEVRIQPSMALASVRLRFAGLPPLALSPGADGSWTGTFMITRDTDYWIELADVKGHPGANETPFHIKAVPDKPPKVEITEPGKDIRASATNRVPLKILIADDFGVAATKLVFHKLGGAEQVIPLNRESEQDGELLASAELDLLALGLRDYELVAYHAEATDNNTLDGPGVGKSPVYFVEITNEEGSPCLSQCQGQKVNLLVIQKQITADTTALAPDAAAEKFDDLAARQRDAAEFGRMYLEAISAGGASAAASEMEAAIKEMESAAGHLERKGRSEAMPPEENALAHLYQVLRLMPELENLPTTPELARKKAPASEKIRVVLEAIKQKKKEPANNQEIEESLRDAQDLARLQSGLNTALRHAGESGRQGKGTGNRSESASKTKAQGNGSSPGESSAAENQDKSDAEPGEPQNPARLAEKENELSEQAAALAERLQRLAGKDRRLGHNAGNQAGRAAARMAAAGQAIKQGVFGAAGENGFQGELALRNLIAQLERLLKNQPDSSDMASEDFPKEYETLISEYLKKLSHAE